MNKPERKRPTPGMIGLGAGFGCAIVTGIAIRDFSTSWLVRLIVPMVAAMIGIVVGVKVGEMRQSKKD